MTKLQLLIKISEVDDKLLKICEKKPKIKIQKIKKAELERFLDAIETMYEVFTKYSDKEDLNGRNSNDD